MKNFTIESETNNITVHGSAKEAEAVPNSERFSNEAALAKLAANWPAARLVEIWNSLPGETPVRKFKDRATAVSRIWKAIQSLGQTAPAAEEPAPVPDREASETAQPEGVIPETTEPAPATTVAPQSPDVAPEAAPAKTKATRAKKAPKDATNAGVAARGQQDQPGDRDAQARGRHDAGGDHDRDGLAEAHDAGNAERGRLAYEEARAGRHEREGRRQARLLDQKLNQRKIAPPRRRIQPRRLFSFCFDDSQLLRPV